MSEIKQEKLAVLLLRESKRKFEDYLKEDPYEYTKHDLDVEGGEGVFYFFRTKGKTPSWTTYLTEIVPTISDENTRKGTHPAGLVLIRIRVGGNKSRTFAVSFGYGSVLLNPLSYHADFGISTAIAASDSDGVQSIDVRSHEGHQWNKRRQASAETGLINFAVDTFIEMVTNMTTRPTDSGLGNRLSGSSSLQLSIRRLASDIPGLCKELFDLYEKFHASKKYSWARKFKKEQNPKEISKLDAQLFSDLSRRRGLYNSTTLFPSEVIDFQSIDYFKFSNFGKTDQTTQTNVNIDTLASLIDDWNANHDPADHKSLSLDLAKKATLSAIEAGSVVKRWNVYKCLSAEITNAKGKYVLIDGQWYFVTKNFQKLINSEVAQIPTITSKSISKKRGTKTSLKSIVGEREDSYNSRLATWTNGLLLDKQNKYYDNGSSSIEPCDVLLQNGMFVHMKRYKGSNTLSHLFAQGFVSARAFLEDEDFRVHIASQSTKGWVKGISPKAKVDPAKYTVVFGIIREDSKQNTLANLPIFSKMTLAHNCRKIKSMGYDIALWFVDKS